MPYIMQYETWIDRTKAGIMTPRSSQLKAIDAALQGYHKAPGGPALGKLRIALHNWKQSKGYGTGTGKPPWVGSERNKNGAVEMLDTQLYGVDKPLRESVLKDLAELPFYGLEAMAEAEARDAIRQSRAEALNMMFGSRKLTPKPIAAARMASNLKKKLANTKAAGQKVAELATKPAAAAAATAFYKTAPGQLVQKGQEMARELIAEVLSELPTEIVQEVIKMLNELVPNFIHELAAAMTPYLSVAVSGTKAVKFTGQAARSQFKLHQTGQHTGAVGSGDPAAAAMAIMRMIERARNEQAGMATIYATDAAVKGAAIACDAASFGAPAVSGIVTPLQGLATAMAVLGVTVRAVARDVIESRKANRLMLNPGLVRLDGTLFDASPLLGCYFIAASTHSDIINFLVDDIGATGWMFDVEVLMKKHVTPLQTTARSYISDARFEIAGLSGQQAAKDSSRIAKLQAKISKMVPG